MCIAPPAMHSKHTRTWHTGSVRGHRHVPVFLLAAVRLTEHRSFRRVHAGMQQALCCEGTLLYRLGRRCPSRISYRAPLQQEHAHHLNTQAYRNCSLSGVVSMRDGWLVKPSQCGNEEQGLWPGWQLSKGVNCSIHHRDHDAPLQSLPLWCLTAASTEPGSLAAVLLLLLLLLLLSSPAGQRARTGGGALPLFSAAAFGPHTPATAGAKTCVGACMCVCVCLCLCACTCVSQSS